ncbi:MAG: serine/threonine-protein kinase [Myxococcaceae bacterium]
MLGQLGKYELLRVLGVGGMGEVLLARQTGPAGFKKLVVVKKIIDSLATEPAMVKMFLHEAQLIAHLSHPNIVQVIELGQDKGQYFMVMEYVHGQTLRTLLKRAKEQGTLLPPVTVALILAQVLKGLHHAHTASSAEGEPLKLVHRDVTPDNIMVGYGGTVKLLDFGIAKVDTVVAEKTQDGILKGKVAYLSPEQLEGEPLDGRADLFSVGVTMYEALAGERPFVAPTNAAIVHRVLEAEPTPLTTRVPQVPAVLEALTTRALEKKREARIQTAEEFARALEDWALSMRDTSPGTSITDYLALTYDDATRRTPSFNDLQPTGLLTVTPARGFDPATQSSDPGKRRFPRWPLIAGAGALVSAAIAFIAWPKTPPPLEPNPHVQPAIVGAGPQLNHPAPPTPVPVPVQPEKPPEPPVAVAPAKDPEPVEQKNGRVDLRVIPWGEVFEGKRRLGLTPMQPVTMVPGSHTLTIVNSDMNKKKDVRVVVRAGHTTALKVDLLQ